MPLRAGVRLARACTKGNTEAVEQLLFAHFFSSEELEEAAAEAIETDNVEILEILEDAGWDVDEYIAERGLPKMISLDYDTPEKCVKFLLQHGADPNVPQDNGILPLADAAAHAPLSVLTSLLEHRAKVKDSSALLAAATSSVCDREERIDLLLRYGARLNELAPRLLWHTNFDRTLPVQRETALHAACRWGFDDSVRHLLSLGADKSILDSHGTRALVLRKQTLRLSLRWFPRTYVSDRAKARFAAARLRRVEDRLLKRYAEGRSWIH